VESARQHLRGNFKKHLSSLSKEPAAAKEFLDEYGSHVLTGITMGGRAVLSEGVEKSGRKRVYLCYRREPYDSAKAIKDIMVISGDSKDIPAPYGFVKIPHDLNSGAGGKFIYLCTRGGAQDEVRRDDDDRQAADVRRGAASALDPTGPQA
jgi:hypothetical protein